MNLTIVDPVEQNGQEALAGDAASLYRAFEQVKDGRKAKGKRYPLALLLTLIPAWGNWQEKRNLMGSLIG